MERGKGRGGGRGEEGREGRAGKGKEGSRGLALVSGMHTHSSNIGTLRVSS